MMLHDKKFVICASHTVLCGGETYMVTMCRAWQLDRYNRCAQSLWGRVLV